MAAAAKICTVVLEQSGGEAFKKIKNVCVSALWEGLCV